MAALAALAVLIGLAFAGSSRELAEGTHVAGVDVGGLSRAAAVARLEAQFEKVSAEPVTFTAGDATFSFGANQLAVEPDWSAAVAAAGRAGGGFGPLRGLRRLHTRFFGAEVLPRLAASDAALEFALDKIAAQVDDEARSAALVRRGLRIEVISERAGARLQRDAAAEVIVRALGDLDRTSGTVALPVVIARPDVTVDMLAPAARRARAVVAAPVVLRGARRSWRIPRQRLAALLELPSDGATRIEFAGADADAYFAELSRRVGRPAHDAGFAVWGERVRVTPAYDGLELDVTATAQALLRAALRPANRVAQLQVVRAKPALTTREALAMGIDRRMSSYKTYYPGTADRNTNPPPGVKGPDGKPDRPGKEPGLGGRIKTPTGPRESQVGCTARKGPQGNVVRCSRDLTRASGPRPSGRHRLRRCGPIRLWRMVTPRGAHLAFSLRARAGGRRDAASRSSRVVPATLRLAFLASLARRPSRDPVGVLLGTPRG